MRTVIIRLAEPTGDGELHGVLQEVGGRAPLTFGDERTLLELIRTDHRRPEGDLNDAEDGRVPASGGAASG